MSSKYALSYLGCNSCGLGRGGGGSHGGGGGHGGGFGGHFGGGMGHGGHGGGFRRRGYGGFWPYGGYGYGGYDYPDYYLEQNYYYQPDTIVDYSIRNNWTWDSFVLGSSWTYNQVYTQIINQGNKVYISAVPLKLTARWNNPSDVINEYNSIYFGTSFFNPNGSPTIPDQSNTQFWSWVIQQIS